MRRLATVLVVLGGLLATAPAAQACSLTAQSPASRVKAADAAIYGTVTSVRFVDEVVEEGPPRPEGRRFEAKIRISRVYKGRMGPAVLVSGHTAGGSCGVGELEVGERLSLLLHRPAHPYSVGLGDRITLAELRRATRGRWHRTGPA